MMTMPVLLCVVGKGGWDTERKAGQAFCRQHFRALAEAEGNDASDEGTASKLCSSRQAACHCLGLYVASVRVSNQSVSRFACPPSSRTRTGT